MDVTVLRWLYSLTAVDQQLDMRPFNIALCSFPFLYTHINMGDPFFRCFDWYSLRSLAYTTVKGGEQGLGR